MSVSFDEAGGCDQAFLRSFPLHRACRDGDVGALLRLSRLSVGPLNAEDSGYGWTPLHWAAHYGQLDCLVQLVQMGCQVDTVSSRFNQTPSHTAAFAGHPHCVVWLTQAGANLNQQDCVGEAPIHKAARCGSLECLQVLLMGGAKPQLQNTSGQTAADVARAHGFHSCSGFIEDAEKNLEQEVDLHGNRDGAPCGQELFNRKRQLATMDSNHLKRARRAEPAEEQVQSMNVETVAEPNSGHAHTPSCPPINPCHRSPLSSRVSDRPAAAAPPPHSSWDMCGSLHRTGSPSSCVSHRPSWWGLMGAEPGDFLHYGHYHGFGDTAEEFSDGAHGRCKQASANGGGATLLYHGS